jgi:hypothetical protein
MSVIGATADVICSKRVFRLLTHLGSGVGIAAVGQAKLRTLLHVMP